MVHNEKNYRNHQSKRFHFDNTFLDNPCIYDSIILYQIGDLNCAGGYSFGEHKQYCYEISYIVSGKGIYCSNGHIHPVKQGDIYINRPGELHNYEADIDDPFRFFYLGFDFGGKITEQNSIQHIKNMFDQVNNPVISDNLGIQDNFIKIINELINYKSYSEMLIKVNLYQIVIYAYRNYYDRWEKNYAHQYNIDETKKIVYEIVNYIDMNLDNISELTMIADDLGYSYFHISHAFSRETGLTIKEYFNQKRFEKAVELLKDSDLSISGIAEVLHYQSIHPFSTAFHKRFGVSPSEYQNTVRSCKLECYNKSAVAKHPQKR